MKFLLPETTIDFRSLYPKDISFSSFKELILKKNVVKINTLFGEKEVKYHSELGELEIRLTRTSDAAFGIPIYPTARMIFPSNQAPYVNVSVSIYWMVFIYFFYFLLIIAGIYHWNLSFSVTSKIVLMSKLVSSLLLFNLMLFGYHFYELRNIKKIIIDLLYEHER
jgi:hypothetical protein